MNVSEFASKIRTKYPGSYDSMDDAALTQKVLDKYPQYQDQVSTDDNNPGVIKSAALGAMSGVPLAETAISGIESLSPNKTYEQAHNELEQAKDAAWQAHPVAYGGGKTAGLIGTAAVAPEGLIGAAATGAGYGIDTSKKPADMIEDAAIGAGTGSILHGIGKTVINPLVEKAGSALGDAAQRGLASLGKDTSLEDIQSYLQNPSAINMAGTKEDIANKLSNLTGDIGKASGQLSQNARGMLSPDENALNISNIKDAASKALEKYFPGGSNLTKADETAANTIVDQYQRLVASSDGNNGVVPETALRSIIDHIQGATKESVYGNPEAGASQTALKEFGGHLNDLLRQNNPEYAQAMAPASEAVNLSKNLGDQFKLENGKPTDATAGKLNNLLKGKPDETDLATQLKNMTGTDITAQLQNAQTNENFNASGPGGALKMLMTGLGYGGGRITGIPGAGIGGAALGRAGAEGIDGGHVAKSILDMYMKGTSNATLKTYGPILINAAKQGGNSLAATHFVLATSHPEYQHLIEQTQNNTQQPNQEPSE